MLASFFPVRDYFDLTVTPPERQAKMRSADMRQLYSTIGTARERLIFTYFSKCDLESAELLKLKIARVVFEGGKRVCRLSPSVFLGTLIGE